MKQQQRNDTMHKKIFQIMILCGVAASTNEAMAQASAPSASSELNCTMACNTLADYCSETGTLQIDFSNKNNYCTNQINTTFSKYAAVSCDKIKAGLSSVKVPKTLVKLDCHQVKDICMKNCIDNIIKQ